MEIDSGVSSSDSSVVWTGVELGSSLKLASRINVCNFTNKTG
jgi:hypothetical protein